VRTARVEADRRPRAVRLRDPRPHERAARKTTPAGDAIEGGKLAARQADLQKLRASHRHDSVRAHLLPVRRFSQSFRGEVAHCAAVEPFG
jgi:hypothetical protein